MLFAVVAVQRIDTVKAASMEPDGDDTEEYRVSLFLLYTFLGSWGPGSGRSQAESYTDLLWSARFRWPA